MLHPGPATPLMHAGAPPAQPQQFAAPAYQAPNGMLDVVAKSLFNVNVTS